MPLAAAVDLGGLVEIARDRRQAGQEQHHVEADELPDADRGERRQHERGSLRNANRGEAQRAAARR